MLYVPQSPLWFSVAIGGTVEDPEEVRRGNEIIFINTVSTTPAIIVSANTATTFY